jgi:hypothetical protein
MAVGLPFTATHVASIAARAAELERLGEYDQDPHVLARAARLYTLAVRVADDIDERLAPPFTPADLARIRDELRTLATEAAASEIRSDYSVVVGRKPADTAGEITRAFREVAVRIEQRLASDEHQPDIELQA